MDGRVSKVPLSRRFFIWNVVAVLVSFGVTALAVMIYSAIRAFWSDSGNGPSGEKDGMTDGPSGFPEPPIEHVDGLYPMPVEALADYYAGAVLVAVVCFLFTFLTLNLLLSRRFSHSIIAPVERLRDAAVKISEGDLDGGIADEGEGEVGDLSRSLEQMRIKLKESIHMQQRYDDNRKFLLSSISHDLKTPVTSIIGYIEGIIDGVAAAPEKRAQYLEIARGKAVQVNNMIDDLLLYSKLDLNQLPFQFESTDAGGYFGDCLEDHRYAFEQAKVRFELIDELQQPVSIRIDRERFKRVMQNVLDNARKHAPPSGGVVELLLRETRASAIIEVRDNGPGIPDDVLPHIFDRFYRADKSRSNQDGSGLGLAIAKQIVEGHEGRIWATSKLGEGTRIMISLKKV